MRGMVVVTLMLNEAISDGAKSMTQQVEITKVIRQV
jgi:hypothetical protein